MVSQNVKSLNPKKNRSEVKEYALLTFRRYIFTTPIGNKKDICMLLPEEIYFKSGLFRVS